MSGSVEILSHFKETKKPVSYEDCWVISGVLTTRKHTVWSTNEHLANIYHLSITTYYIFSTVLRAIGVSSRPVTNFVSGHDADMNRSVDLFYNEQGEDMNSSDTIWLVFVHHQMIVVLTTSNRPQIGTV